MKICCIFSIIAYAADRRASEKRNFDHFKIRKWVNDGGWSRRRRDRTWPIGRVVNTVNIPLKTVLPFAEGTGVCLIEIRNIRNFVARGTKVLQKYKNIRTCICVWSNITNTLLVARWARGFLCCVFRDAISSLFFYFLQAICKRK